MRVLTVSPPIALCIDRHGVEGEIDTSLVGDVAPNQWLLAFQGAARELIDEAHARDIDRALAALDAAMRGDLTAIEGAFADLIDREPQLPEFLR